MEQPHPGGGLELDRLGALVSPALSPLRQPKKLTQANTLSDDARARRTRIRFPQFPTFFLPLLDTRRNILPESSGGS